MAARYTLQEYRVFLYICIEIRFVLQIGIRMLVSRVAYSRPAFLLAMFVFFYSFAINIENTYKKTQKHEPKPI